MCKGALKNMSRITDPAETEGESMSIEKKHESHTDSVINVDSIENGIIIDHITSGCGMKIYELLKLGTLGVPVSMMLGVSSGKMGKKDIIKIDADVALKLDVIGFVDPEATVNIVKNGKVLSKQTIGMPEKLVNVIKCKNPRCITSCEQELDSVFNLTDSERGEYRCMYCETQASKN